MPQMVWTTSSEGDLDYCNRRYLDYLGMTFDEAVADGWRSVVSPADVPVCEARWAQSLQSGDDYEVEYRLHRADGSYRWHLARAVPLRASDGNIRFWVGTCTDIHDAREALQALRQSEERLRSVLMNTPTVIFALDPRGVFTLSEGEGLAALGVTPGQVVGQSVFDLYRDHPEVLAHCRRALAGERVTAVTQVAGRTFENVFSPLKDAGDGMTGVIGVATDVTQRARAEAALRENERRLRATFEASPFGIVQVDAEGRLSGSNRVFQRMLGYTTEDLHRKTLHDITHPDDLAEDRRLHGEMLAGRRDSYSLEKRYLCRDGRWFWANQTVSLVRDDQGRPWFGIGAVEDITERRAAEQALRASEGRYRGLVEFSPEGVVVYCEDRLVYANPAALALFGASHPEQLLGRLVFDVVHPDFHALARERARRSQEEGQPSPLTEQKYLRLDGTAFDVEAVSTPVTWEGKAAGQVLIRDISERKRTEEAVRCAQEELEARVESRTAELARANQALQDEVIERQWTEVELQKVLAQSEQMLAAITSILIGVDELGQVTTWNAAARRAFGKDRNDVLGQPFDACDIRWDWPAVRKAVAECEATQQPVRADDVRYMRDGKECFLGITINPVCGYSDVPMGFLLLAADITERRLLESQLGHAQKLESIGQLAAGIAHELNTPIQYVGDNTRFLQDSFADLLGLLRAHSALADAARRGPIPAALLDAVEAAAESADLEYLLGEIPNAITQSLEGVDRVAAIVRAMKEFSHPGTAHKTAVDLNRSLESTATVARNEWKYIADLVTGFDGDLPLVPCLPGELNQVFLNIIVNAAHAIGDVVGDGAGGKGTITVTTRAVPPAAPTHAEIRIADTGTGIRPEIRSRIFDPFFTTKGVGRGTGQGLAIAHGIVVEKHGGTIVCESEMGQGTTFVIRLPLDGGGGGA